MNRSEKLKLENRLRRQLVSALDSIWFKSENMALNELAAAAGLSVSTVTRMYYGAWKRPQVLTIQKLASAVGYTVEFADGNVVVRITPEELERIRNG